MNSSRQAVQVFTVSLTWLFLLALANFGEARAVAGDLQLQAQLVWATNDPKPDGKALNDVDPKLRDKLRNVFRWTNYFEVSSTNFVSVQGAVKKVPMSKHCEIEVTNLGDSRIEVKLYGKGTLVVTKRQTFNPKEPLVLAGDDKNSTAWFVAITPGKAGR